MRSIIKPTLKRQHGFTLLEVMIAVFILAVGLLGLAQLQITAMKFAQTAELRSQATLLAGDILDSIRANQADAHAGHYAISLNDASPSTASSVAQADIAAWRTNLANVLPAGNGQINCDTFDPLIEFRCDITIVWCDITTDNCSDADNADLSSIFISGGI